MRKLSKSEKEKRGTLDSRHREGSPGQALDYLPDAPEWLSDRAKDVFVVVCMDLHERSLLFDADLSLIAGYATETAQFIDLTKIINREGYSYEDKNGQLRKHPLLIPQRGAYQSMISTAKSLGLSPYFRDKVNAVPVEVEDYDPLAEYMLQ